MTAMHGLTVRWSLASALEGTEQVLADYVAESSHPRFSGMAGLSLKTWRMRPGEWFEGCYVFESDSARQAFEDQFAAGAATAPGSTIIGSPPVLIEPCVVVAVAEGGAGLLASASFG